MITVKHHKSPYFNPYVNKCRTFYKDKLNKDNLVLDKLEPSRESKYRYCGYGELNKQAIEFLELKKRQEKGFDARTTTHSSCSFSVALMPHLQLDVS